MFDLANLGIVACFSALALFVFKVFRKSRYDRFSEKDMVFIAGTIANQKVFINFLMDKLSDLHLECKGENLDSDAIAEESCERMEQNLKVLEQIFTTDRRDLDSYSASLLYLTNRISEAKDYVNQRKKQLGH